MILVVILLISGFILLIKGADWLVHGASALAKKQQVSDMVIGLTIVAFGTSTPEFVVNTMASFENHSDIVYGNILGSNIVNLFLILGIVGVIAPFVVKRATIRKEMPISVFAVFIIWVLSNSLFPFQKNELSRFDGLILLFFFILFLGYIFRQMKKDKMIGEPISDEHLPNWKIWGFIILGLAGLILGGKLVVDNAIKIAESMDISEKIIGLTIVAVGTSLPELVTSVVAALKKNSDIALGNVIGSNIFNVLMILGASALIRPVQFNTAFNTEIYLLAAGTSLLFAAMFTGTRKKLDRWESAILLVIYLAYTGWLIAGEI
jgi:cation:H+ antiporter